MRSRWGCGSIVPFAGYKTCSAARHRTCGKTSNRRHDETPPLTRGEGLLLVSGAARQEDIEPIDRDVQGDGCRHLGASAARGVRSWQKDQRVRLRGDPLKAMTEGGADVVGREPVAGVGRVHHLMAEVAKDAGRGEERGEVHFWSASHRPGDVELHFLTFPHPPFLRTLFLSTRQTKPQRSHAGQVMRNCANGAQSCSCVTKR